MGLVRRIAEIRQKHESCHGTIPLSRRIRSGLSSSGHIKGFTIVELLIVIVVIAILAAISVVAYTGIQNNAHDTAVKSDLANFAKQIQMFHATNGVHPQGGYETTAPGVATGNAAIMGGDIKLRIAHGSYIVSEGSGAANFMYCTGLVEGTGREGFAVAAASKSRNVFRYSVEGGVEHVRSGAGGVASSEACSGILYPRTMAYGYFINRGGWQDWTK